MLATYDYYTTQYLGVTLGEMDFFRYGQRASLFILHNCDSTLDKRSDEVKACTCAIAEAMFSNSGRSVKSVSNDGYSEVYADESAEDEYSDLLQLYLPQYTQLGDEVVFI